MSSNAAKSLPGMPDSKKPHFNKTSFRLMQKQQEFVEKEIHAEEQKYRFEKQNAPIASPAELQKVQASLSKLNSCFTELLNVVASYAPRVADMATTVWNRQRILSQRLASSLRTQMHIAQELQDNQDSLDERNERLTSQTKRSLGIMNSDVQKLETELIQTNAKLTVTTKLNDSLQCELERLREQIHGNGSSSAVGTSFYELNQEFEKGLNMTEASMARNEAHLNHLSDVYSHFEIKCLEAVLLEEQVLKVNHSTQTERMSQRAVGTEEQELAPIPKVEPVPGLHIPRELRKLMAAYPESKRIMSQQAMDKLILKVFIKKISEDKSNRRNGQAPRSMSEHLYEFLNEKYGLQSLADPHTAEFVASLRHYKEKSFYAQCMGDFLGCFSRPDARPPYDFRLDAFLLSILESILQTHAEKSSEPPGFLETTGEIFMDIGHEVAEKLFASAPQEMLHEMFGALNALDIVSPPTAKDDKVRLDAYLQILLHTWQALDTRWKLRMQRKYNEHAKFYYSVNGFMIETTDSTTTREGAKFYAVCAFTKFAQILEETDPSIPDSRVRLMFEEALEYLNRTQTEEHEKHWQAYVDPVTKRTFYYSAATNESYWYRPPIEKFEVGEITLPAFVHVAEKYRLGKPPHPWNAP